MKDARDPSRGRSGDNPPGQYVYDRDANPVEFGRVVALSDGVFAIALTLLVLDLALPGWVAHGDLMDELRDRQSNFIALAISVFLVGNAWFSHHRLFAQLQAVNTSLLVINILYLGLVVLIPFVQGVLAAYPNEALAYVLFAGLLSGIIVVDVAIFVYARSAGMLCVPVEARSYRIELLRGGGSTLVMVASMPLAFALGPFTILVWLLTLPVNVAANLLLSENERERTFLPGWLRQRLGI